MGKVFIAFSWRKWCPGLILPPRLTMSTNACLDGNHLQEHLCLTWGLQTGWMLFGCCMPRARIWTSWGHLGTWGIAQKQLWFCHQDPTYWGGVGTVNTLSLGAACTPPPHWCACLGWGLWLSHNRLVALWSTDFGGHPSLECRVLCRQALWARVSMSSQVAHDIQGFLKDLKVVTEAHGHNPLVFLGLIRHEFQQHPVLKKLGLKNLVPISLPC